MCFATKASNNKERDVKRERCGENEREQEMYGMWVHIEYTRIWYTYSLHSDTSGCPAAKLVTGKARECAAPNTQTHTQEINKTGN